MQVQLLLVTMVCLIAVSPALARLIRLPAPTILFLAGCLLSAVPAAAHVELPPEAVLLIVLPVLLFWEGYSTSIHHLRRYWRPVLLLGVPLVVITAAAAAVAAHAAGLPWIAAWALGAAVAPTDASAVAAYARALPGRWMTVLRAESLINDGTALVVLAAVIAVSQGEAADGWSFGADLFRSYAFGLTAGLVAGMLGLLVLRRVVDPVVTGAVALALPFAAAVPAEAVHGSGVVAVVSCALTVSRRSRQVTAGRPRLQAYGFWEITTFLLGGALFVMSGLQVRRLFTAVDQATAVRLAAWGALITMVVLAVRVAWLFVCAWVIRLVDRRPVQRELRAPARTMLVLGWSGMRGGISIAAALTVPPVVAGTVFPDRPEILILTFMVVAMTLLVQGATLPLVIRWSRISTQHDDPQPAIRSVNQLLADRAVTALDQPTVRGDASPEIIERILADLRDERGRGGELSEHERHTARVRLRLLEHLRRELVTLASRNEVEDSVMWQVQERLDLEEARWSTLLGSAGSENSSDQPARAARDVVR
ncbi:putative Na(+)/H(+) exchanger [Actinoplanes cyaneus]|uniref:Na(+)/H(+) exchanger n=1 Tax=Actinoplanes cyaneus TaxID=52696 RepID=A0A919IRD6_9ACTN|nr:Na+/H+ antiporter [Actinoplanes cyaneus]MCW2144093.1 sodium/proton antiporter, CPA1 family [Actinoplanes cyaneus]GID70784.1 putative Na(+)/H(+) exchanger [Actinoplanes cyaneus]